MIGVAVSPKGQPCLATEVEEAAAGIPTRSMITVVVNQNDASVNQDRKTENML